MMDINEIRAFRERLASDPENREARRSLHENYEWLEGYWRSQFGGNFFDQVWQAYGEYYWQSFPRLKEIATEFANQKPVGNNQNIDYAPSGEVITATNVLMVLDKTPQLHFRALMIIVRQIRNNMFHGKKMDIVDETQYQRNKELVRFAAEITGLILDNL